MNEYNPVLEYISKGCYTIADITGEFTEFDPAELEETLEGFVAFNKIKKTRHYFHGNDIVPPEKKTRTTTGNALDLTQVEYPDWVKTDRDKVKYLTSSESPKIPQPMHFFIDDVDTKETKRLLFDSLNSNHILTSVFLSPRNNEGGNKIDYMKDVTQARGFNVIHRDGVFFVNVSLLKCLQGRYANTKTEGVTDRFTQEFKSYEEFKTWIIANL